MNKGMTSCVEQLLEPLDVSLRLRDRRRGVQGVREWVMSFYTDVPSGHACAEEGTPRQGDLFKVEKEESPPAQELQIEIHHPFEGLSHCERHASGPSTLSVSRRIHHGHQVGHACAEFIGRRTAFPAERDGLRCQLVVGCMRYEAKTGL